MGASFLPAGDCTRSTLKTLPSFRTCLFHGIYYNEKPFALLSIHSCRGFPIDYLKSNHPLLCSAAGLPAAVLAAFLSPQADITALIAFAGVAFAFLTHETRQGGIVTPLPAVCWLAFTFGGAVPAVLTSLAVILTGLLCHWKTLPVRNLFLSHLPALALIIIASDSFGLSSSVWLLIPAGVVVQTAAGSVLAGWKPERAVTTAVNWLINGMAAFTLYFFVISDGFTGGMLVVGVMLVFALHAAQNGSKLIRYSGRIGILSVQNRLMSFLYSNKSTDSIFFHDGAHVWTMQGKPAPGIPTPDSIRGGKEKRWTVFPVGDSAFITSGTVSDDLNSLNERDKEETLQLFEVIWKASFSKRRLEIAFLGAAGMLVRIADKKDSDTHRHSIRVSQTAAKLGRIMGLSESELFQLRIGAMLHDIGKLTIPGSLIMKKGLLTEAERKIIETHPRAGARLLEPMERYDSASSVVLQHHERVDGTGYPKKLKGKNISLHARIVAVADTFDAIISPRAYHLGKPSHIALREIKKYRGTRYDAAVVDALEEMLR